MRKCNILKPMLRILLVLVLWILAGGCMALQDNEIIVGAERTSLYLDVLKDKNVGVVVNNTSIAKGEHLVDFLLKQHVDVKKIFAPEHGFRGDVSAGGEVEDGLDKSTGLPVFSLYGKNKKPTAGHFDGLDVVIFDIQDVGCRFYTYISTMHYVIEACAEYDIPLIIFGPSKSEWRLCCRPNPRGRL